MAVAARMIGLEMAVRDETDIADRVPGRAGRLGDRPHVHRLIEGSSPRGCSMTNAVTTTRSPGKRPSAGIVFCPVCMGRIHDGDTARQTNRVSSDLGGFLALSFIVIVTPGPDTALTIRNTLLGGRAAGLATAAGVALGQALWSVATSAGVVALLVAAEPAFVALKLAGAAYLVILGGQAVWVALRRGRSTKAAPAPHTVRLHPQTALRQGVISNLTNPKMAVFFPSLLPQFVSPGRTSFFALLTLGLVFCLMTLSWLTVYAFVVARAGDVLRRSGVRRFVEGITGAVLVAFGIRVATTVR